MLAFALAIAITEVAIGFFHQRPPDTRESVGPISTVVMERRPSPTPAPTPRPTKPPPTPRPTLAPVPHVTIAAVAQRAAPKAHKPRGGTQSAHVATPHHAKPKNFAVPHARGGAGVAVAPGAGSGNGAGDGSGDANGGGAGNGTGGTGNGAVNADTPCGFVEFIPINAPKYTNGVASETIRATVHFPDGHAQSELFPYPWTYTNAEQTDPWSTTNLRRKDSIPVYAQLPPPGSDPSRFPELIRYLLDHTQPNGATTLAECPRSR